MMRLEPSDVGRLVAKGIIDSGVLRPLVEFTEVEIEIPTRAAGDRLHQARDLYRRMHARLTSAGITISTMSKYAIAVQSLAADGAGPEAGDIAAEKIGTREFGAPLGQGRVGLRRPSLQQL
jgi:hypothetical protein